MTVETTSTYAGPYPLNGIATAFPFSFKALTPAEVGVEIDGTTVDPLTYTVQLTAQGGTAVFASPPAGAELYVVSKPDFRQGISFSNQSAFLPASHNEANDRAAVRDQVLAEGLVRAIQLPLGEEAPVLPPAAARAGGNKIIAPDPVTGAITVLDGSSFAGDTGPADNTYPDKPSLAASDTTRGVASLKATADQIGTRYYWTPGNFTGRIDVIVSTYNGGKPISQGAWVPQVADGIASQADPTALPQTVQQRLDQLDTLPAAAFDVTPGSSDDQAPAINAAMAVGMALRKDVIAPPGVITIGSSIVVGSYFKLRMPGRGETRFVMKPGFLGPMFIRKPGVITNVDIDVDARGNGVPNEIGFHMDSSARAVAPFDGGLWYARLAGRFDNFGGKAVWFQGGAIALGGNPQSNVFHQFINLDDLSVNRFVDGSLGVVLTGLCGQFSFGARTEINGRADGGSHPTGWNVVASREFTQSSTGNAGCAADALNLDGTYKAGWGLTASGLGSGTDTNCYAVQFHSTASIQFSKGGVWVDRGTVQCDNVYCEGLFRAFHVTGSGTLEVRNSYGGNIAYNFESPTDTTGSAFSQATGLITGGSNAWAGYFMGSYHVQLGSGICDVKPDRFAIMDNTGTPRMPADLPSKTSMLLGVTNNRLNIQTYTDVFVGLDTNSLLTTIDTTLGVGAVITLRGFLNGTLRIGGGGNITSGAIEAGQVLVLRPQDCVTLRRVDTFGTFVVTGASIAPLVGTSMPSSGYYYAGEFVRNTGALGTGPVILGWQRLTTGNSHTAGTDWRVVQATGA